MIKTSHFLPTKSDKICQFLFIQRQAGAYSGYKSGHELNNQLLRKLIRQPESWEEVTFGKEEGAPICYQHPAHAL